MPETNTYRGCPSVFSSGIVLALCHVQFAVAVCGRGWMKVPAVSPVAASRM
ncbi:MAG TPA: hypothetical protein VK915_11700 [Gaiellaceae bacterium]|nr:hypothetical protein [Gaiellaceae bacterium]